MLLWTWICVCIVHLYVYCVRACILQTMNAEGSRSEVEDPEGQARLALIWYKSRADKNEQLE